MYCGSADGTLLPPYVVYKAENLWSTWMEGGTSGTRYNRSKSGWFDITCFTDWFEFMFLPHIRHLKGPKVLLGDNLSSHFSHTVLQLAAQHDIRFICLPPNSTHLLQPLDVAFFAPMKKKWRKILYDWKVQVGNRTRTVNKQEFPKLLGRLHVELCGKDGCSASIRSGFMKCGIHPLNRHPVLQRVPAPRVQDDENQISSRVSSVFVQLLQDMRGQKEKQTTQKKSRLNVTPGKSISAEDLKNAKEVTNISEATEDAQKQC